MRLFGKILLGLGLAAVLSPAAMAQGGGRGGFGGFGGGMLLSNKSVQEELKLTSEQTEKVTKWAEEQRAKGQETRTAIQDTPEADRPAKIAEIGKKNAEELAKFSKEVLQPEQAKRFRQISLQSRGLGVFAGPGADAKVAEELKLTDDQKTKLGDLVKELGEKRREIMADANGDFTAAREKMTPITKEYTEKAHAVLTDDQKKAWKELVGAPFEVKFERRGN